MENDKNKKNTRNLELIKISAVDELLISRFMPVFFKNLLVIFFLGFNLRWLRNKV